MEKLDKTLLCFEKFQEQRTNSIKGSVHDKNEAKYHISKGLLNYTKAFAVPNYYNNVYGMSNIIPVGNECCILLQKKYRYA